jgi:hypothetical protein
MAETEMKVDNRAFTGREKSSNGTSAARIVAEKPTFMISKSLSDKIVLNQRKKPFK